MPEYNEPLFLVTCNWTGIPNTVAGGFIYSQSMVTTFCAIFIAWIKIYFGNKATFMRNALEISGKTRHINLTVDV